jgi:hypothetical protein
MPTTSIHAVAVDIVAVVEETLVAMLADAIYPYGCTGAEQQLPPPSSKFPLPLQLFPPLPPGSLFLPQLLVDYHMPPTLSLLSAGALSLLSVPLGITLGV